MSTDPAPKPLDQISCTQLRGVGPHMANRLRAYGIDSVQDLLLHLPTRYQDRTRLSTIASLKPGDFAVVEGIIETVKMQPGRRMMLLCYLSDGTGILALRFFHFNATQKNRLQPGIKIRCIGEVKGWTSTLEMVHPEYQLNVTDPLPSIIQSQLTPIYPLTEGLSQHTFRHLTDQALALLDQTTHLLDCLPEKLVGNLALPNLAISLRYLHRPPVDADLQLLHSGKHPAQQRLILEELLVHQLSLLRSRQVVQTQTAPALIANGKLSKIFLTNLPFNLTQAQQRVITEIAEDLKLPTPMLRLVQGDVGSGKTIVAALAALQAIESHHQVALMAPTELLAKQHFVNFKRWLEPLGLQVAFLGSKLPSSEQQLILKQLAANEVQVVIGTHALFQKQVNFAQLGLVIIDEQHRFGVQQRLSLREKGRHDEQYPHQLIMTATPIPRTLAMVAYADLDHSIIDELPPGRTPITTAVVSNTKRDEVIARIREVCDQKKQVYWVCTLIDESDALQCQAAETTAIYLQQNLPELQIGLLHSRVKPDEAAIIMHKFQRGEIHLLVATTVIEVGVDVPNASLMVIENAERLGLAQLHQLRGRVGRGSAVSHCVLMYQHPLSFTAKQRLTVMRDHTDGFIIAEKDLAIRGPGEMLGTKQAGSIRFRIADLERDQYLLPKVQTVAQQLQQEQKELAEMLIERWLGGRENFGNA